jgi:hypothetical protein
VLIRGNAPVLGANSSPYQEPGEWQLNVSYRNLTSDHHWNGTVEQVQRRTLGTYVINTQNALDLNIGYSVTERFNVTLGVPFVAASWGVPSPIAPTPGPRALEHGRGLGDISVTARYWLFDTKTHAAWNIGAGGGLKMPTGNAATTDSFPPITGGAPRVEAVDMSVQPGDGGWGVMLEAQGFRRIKRAFVFGSGNYLLNPKDTNNTPSVLAGLGLQPTPATVGRFVNSVPDQYIARLGGAVSIWKGFGASAAWRVEGLPRYDLIGQSHGFRRPGIAMFIEPGITYSNGRSTVTFNLPVGYYYNRKPDPYTGAPGDATFPRLMALGSYSVRFGGKRALQPVTPVPTTATASSESGSPQ